MNCLRPARCMTSGQEETRNMNRHSLDRRHLTAAALASVAAGVWPQSAWSRQVALTVSQAGSRLHSVPFLIAKERGWFRDLAGLQVRGFIGSSGGATTLRNAMSADVPYGEVSLPAAMAALQQGVELTIVHGGVQTLADQMWVVRPGETAIGSPGDLAGRKIGFSAPGSLSDIVSEAMIDSAGLTGRAERKPVGPVKSGLAALRDGSIDVLMLPEPLLSRSLDSARAVWSAADVFGPCMQTVGVARTDWLLRHGSVMQGIIAARRRGVKLIRDEPPQAALAMAAEFGLEPGQALALIERMLVGHGLWSEGAFHDAGMQAMERGLSRIGVLPPAGSDWRRALRADYLS